MVNRSITLSTSAAAATDVTYTVEFNTDPTAGPANIEAIVVEFCDDSAIIGDASCIVPSGFNSNKDQLALANQVGINGLSVNTVNSDNNTLILTRGGPVNINPNTLISFDLGASGANDGITNPDLGNYSFFARVLTYSTAAAAVNYSSGNPGIFNDANGIALTTANAVRLSTVSPPILFFCVAQSFSVPYDCSSATSLYVNFGIFDKNETRTGISQLILLTNAGSGLNVTIHGTTLTSGNNEIKALVPPHASNSGTEQFGLNLVANTIPTVGLDPTGPGIAQPVADYSQINKFKFGNGDAIISSPGATSWSQFTISYIVNINQNQHPGIYTTTLTFIALANF